ncbi:hypothetical protein RI367_003550 [Sorochytrium milnesiophthora]
MPSAGGQLYRIIFYHISNLPADGEDIFLSIQNVQTREEALIDIGRTSSQMMLSSSAALRLNHEAAGTDVPNVLLRVLDGYEDSSKILCTFALILSPSRFPLGQQRRFLLATELSPFARQIKLSIGITALDETVPPVLAPVGNETVALLCSLERMAHLHFSGYYQCTARFVPDISALHSRMNAVQLSYAESQEPPAHYLDTGSEVTFSKAGAIKDRDKANTWDDPHSVKARQQHAEVAYMTANTPPTERPSWDSDRILVRVATAQATSRSALVFTVTEGDPAPATNDAPKRLVAYCCLSLCDVAQRLIPPAQRSGAGSWIRLNARIALPMYYMGPFVSRLYNLAAPATLTINLLAVSSNIVASGTTTKPTPMASAEILAETATAATPVADPSPQVLESTGALRQELDARTEALRKLGSEVLLLRKENIDLRSEKQQMERYKIVVKQQELIIRKLEHLLRDSIPGETNDKARLYTHELYPDPQQKPNKTGSTGSLTEAVKRAEQAEARQRALEHELSETAQSYGKQMAELRKRLAMQAASK